jgi:hypothetical protein
LTFSVGSQGRLLGGTSTISAVFPAGTEVPTSIASSNVTVNGIASASVTTDDATNLVTVTVPSGVSIGNDGAVTLVIGSSSDVIKNPNANVTVALQLNTSVEPAQVSSLNYEIGTGGSKASFDSINLGTSTVNTASAYTLFFTPKNDVEVGDHLILTFPVNTTVPSTISTSDIQITVNGGSAGDPQSITTNPSVRQIDMVTDVKLRKNRSHEVAVASAASVLNPSVPLSTYAMALRTSDESTDLVSPQYTISASATAVSVGSIIVSPTRASEDASYTVPLTLGSAGGLLLGSNTITIAFPVGTTIPGTILTSTVTVNGATATAVATNPGARTVTITTPVTVANSGTVTIIFAVASGIANPASGSHTLPVQTSAETTNGTSPSYTITTNATLAVNSALPNPSAINANAGYVIVFKVGSGSPLSIGDQITIDFDDLTGVPALMAPDDIRVNNVAATVAPFTDVVSKRVTVTTPVSVLGNGEVSLAFTNAAGLSNPAATGLYDLTVATNIQPSAQASPSYTITPATTSVSTASVTPSLATVDQLATYTVVFSTGAEGALQAGSSTIIVTFNDSTTLGSIVSSNVTVNGIQPQTVVVSGQEITVTVPPSVTIGNSGLVTVVLGSSTAVITNPSTVGDYGVTVATSVEPIVVPSLTYSIGGAATAVTPASVTPAPTGIAVASAYTVSFNVGASGALTSGSSTITLTFPVNTTVPFSVNASDITVNTIAVIAAPVSSPTGRTITFTSPVNVSGSGAVTVVVALGAGLLNPSSGGSYTMKVHTSEEVTKVTSLAYTITAPSTTVTAADVVPTPNGVNSTAAYQVGFRVGSSGGLQGGVSTITLTMPTGTMVPATIAPSKVTINGSSASSVSVIGQQIIITVPVAVTISNSDSVTINIAEQALIQNPQIQGQYTLQVETSSEPTSVASNPYTIGAATTTVTSASVTPNPAATSSTASYTVQFNTGGSGGLQSGTSTITVTLNASSTVGTQTVTGALVNGVGASAVSDAATRTVVLTVPASVSIGNGDPVTVFVPSGVITNPASESAYTLDVKTSVEGTDIASSAYAITTAATTVTAVTGTPSPTGANVAAQYTIAFSTGADGPLISGTGTVTVTFPANTTIPASITPSDITVDGTAVTAPVSIDQSSRTVTFTTPVGISASSAVSVVFLVAAGVTNPSTGTFTLQVRTSVEATNISSGQYAITAASTTITTPSVSVSPNVVETNGAYTVSFTTGGSGRLLASTSTITVVFPAGTTVPATIAATSVTVNGIAASQVDVLAQAVTVTVPGTVAINNNASVVLVLGTAAALYNPSTVSS